jgi:hypothetical protein
MLRTLMPPDNQNVSMKFDQVAEHDWEEHFDGRIWPLKSRIFVIPFGANLNKYHASVFVGGNWQLLHQWDHKPSEGELKAKVKAQMPVWKAIGIID